MFSTPVLPSRGQQDRRLVRGLFALEVKVGATVRSEGLAGLRHLAQRLDRRLVAGYVLYTGQQTLPCGDRLRAIPIDTLWQTNS